KYHQPDRPPPDDGFLDRFLLSYPVDLRAAKETWRAVSAQAIAAWGNTIDTLLTLQKAPVALLGGKPLGEAVDRPVIVTLSQGARHEWERFTEAHAAELNAESFLDYLNGAWSKFRGYCGRLALILHELWRICDGRLEETPISGET